MHYTMAPEAWILFWDEERGMSGPGKQGRPSVRPLPIHGMFPPMAPIKNKGKNST